MIPRAEVRDVLEYQDLPPETRRLIARVWLTHVELEDDTFEGICINVKKLPQWLYCYDPQT